MKGSITYSEELENAFQYDTQKEGLSILFKVLQVTTLITKKYWNEKKVIKLVTFICHGKIKDDISRMTSISISSQVTTKEPKTQTLKGDAVTKSTGLAQCPKLIRQVLVQKERSLFRTPISNTIL